MRNDIKLNGWFIESESVSPHEDFFESVFFVGNGRIGCRGYLPQTADSRPLKAGLYIAGIFEEIKDKITDIVHLPTPVFEGAYVNDKPFETDGSVTRRLHLCNGVFQAEYTLKSGDIYLRVKYERFIALDNTGLFCQRVSLKAETDAVFDWCTGVSLAARNCPVPDDQVKSNDEVLSLYEESTPTFFEDTFTVSVKTPKTGLTIAYDCTVCVDKSGSAVYKNGAAVGFVYNIDLSAGQEICIDKFCYITTSRDCDSTIQKPSEWSYDNMLRAHEAAWEARWRNMHLPRLPHHETETALRFLCAQLIMNAPANDETVSIGARGLTHPRYKGCYFWDTDFFLMPFYTQTHPQTARNLARYRMNNLPAAKAHAAKTSAKGARYPWMASLDGSEQCESWDIGFSEVHITADIVYAIDRYIRETNDLALYPEAATVYIETARFWADRCTRDAAGNANLLFVKGPDEYCGITKNNLFTNMMVKHNLNLAAEAAEWVRANDASKYAVLSINDAEVRDWRKLADDLPVARNPESGHLQQDETFHLLEPINLASIKDGDTASYHKVTFDRVQRYKVIKQADLLLLMSRLPERFTEEEKRQAWEDCEPFCIHDSTLSFASHALFAAQNGYAKEAEAYLQKALFLDLRDVMDNTGKEGLHLANFGESWLALMCLYG